MVIDLVFAILAISGFFLGFQRGIVKTVFTILSLMFGFLVAVKLGGILTNMLSEVLNNFNPYMSIVGFLLAFFGTLLVLRLIGRGIEGFLQTAQVNFINRAAGGFLIAAFFVWIYSGLVWFGDETRIITEVTRRESLTYPYLKKFPLQVKETWKKVFPKMEDMWNNSVQFVDDLREKGLEREEGKTEIRDLDDDESFERD